MTETFLMLQLFEVISSYHLYSIVDTLTETKYDCIYAYNDPEFFELTLGLQYSDVYDQPREQITPFCLTVKHSSANDKSCHDNNDLDWSFEQLSKEGIKSSDLAFWNAPVNTVDDYENYLLINSSELRLSHICNCTNKMYFGAKCQYTFDLIHESFETLLSTHFANLQKITADEAAYMEDADVTYYRRDPLCSGGCLDWRQICNGIVDCINGDDEVSCELLEFNECGADEYRCRSGHCIPIMFAFDTTFDCADRSDEVDRSDYDERLDKCYRTVPHMFCDDHDEAWMMFPCADGDNVDNPLFDCHNGRSIRSQKSLYEGDNTLCWQYILCAQGFDFLFPLLVNCSDLCGENADCWSMMPVACSNNTIVFPPNPVMLSPSVYWVYQTNNTEDRFPPDFICYTQCDHLYPPSLKLHGYSWRSFIQFSNEPFYVSQEYFEIFTSILHLFTGCMNKTMTNHSSAVFHCPLTNRAISSHRIKDEYDDCYLRLDETFNQSVCALNLTQRFQCWTRSEECIPLRFVQNRQRHCSDNSDEVYPQDCFFTTDACDYKRGISQPAIAHYQFKVTQMCSSCKICYKFN